jgi:hypothetical protein
LEIGAFRGLPEQSSEHTLYRGGDPSRSFLQGIYCPLPWRFKIKMLWFAGSGDFLFLALFVDVERCYVHQQLTAYAVDCDLGCFGLLSDVSAYHKQCKHRLVRLLICSNLEITAIFMSKQKPNSETKKRQQADAKTQQTKKNPTKSNPTPKTRKTLPRNRTRIPLSSFLFILFFPANIWRLGFFSCSAVLAV